MGFSRKFKKGDKVRVIKTNDPKYKQIGKIIDYYSSYGYKGVYNVSFENGIRSYYPSSLEKVEDSSNTDIKSNKLSISDLKSGMKVRIRPDLKEGSSKQVYVVPSMANFAGTIQTIEYIKLNNIYLKDQTWVWAIDCFSEIVEEPKEEIKDSEDIELPLKEGQVVTLLDGNQYKVIKNNTSRITCSLCSLGKAKCGEDRCNITHINGKPSCPLVIPAHHYFKLYKDQKTENNSYKPLTISDFKVGMKVRVKENFYEIPVSPELYISSKMGSLRGKTAFIEQVYENTVVVEGYYWSPEWLEIVDDSNNSSNFVEDSSTEFEELIDSSTISSHSGIQQ